jgi:hypothetical protein
LTFLDDIRDGMEKGGIPAAVAQRHTPEIFNWIVDVVAFQGVSDAVARGYIQQHGNVTWSAIADGLETSPSCPLLLTYWHFDGCRYTKHNNSCSESAHIKTCSLPRHILRNGRLNQIAYSLFFFVRDVAQSDLVGWIDDRLSFAPSGAVSNGEELAAERQERLIGPLRDIYGVSDKILCMMLSELLIGSSQSHPHWFEIGKGMITIDTLVHHWFCRSGLIDECGVPHAYGADCYRPGGCAQIIRSVAVQIDATAFNKKFPKTFPRFIQHAIWRFCAADGLDVCNGNRLDDSKPCENTYCQIFEKCDHKPLRKLNI